MTLTSSFQKSFPLRSFRCFVPTLLLVLSAIATPLVAAEKYLTAGHPDGMALLAPPPLADSSEQAADLASARAVFKARTPAEETRAFKDASLSIFSFTPAIGPVFQPGKLPKTEVLFEKVKSEIKDSVNTPKEHWKRSRPYEVDKALSLGKPESSFSYPSGHSTRGTVQALLLAELFPEKRDAILEVGRNIGWDRVLIGKHFPTDIYAGRVLGKAIVRELMASPTFQHDFAEAKAEVLAAQK
jgi:acid phosphatase (class A)